MVSSYLNFFEILKFRQGGVKVNAGICVFCEKLDFSKKSQFLIPQYNELLIILFNFSESGDVEFPIFGDSFIFPKFWKNEFFWKKSRVFSSFAV
jgi:hypothetical protein